MGNNMMLGIIDFVGDLMYTMLSWFTDTLVTPLIKTIIGSFFKAICYACAAFFYLISVFLLQILDFVQLLFRSLAGLKNNQLEFSVNGSPSNSDALMTFLQSDVVVTAFWSCCIVGIFILILTTIFQMIKVEYTAMGAQNSKGPMVSKLLKGLANIILVPALSIIGIFLGNQVLQMVDTATGGGDNVSLGTMIFVAGASSSMWDEHGCPTLLETYVYSQLAASSAVYGLNLPVSFAVLGVAESFGAPFLITEPLGDRNHDYRDSVENSFRNNDRQYSNIFDVFDCYNFFTINYVVIILVACLILKSMFTVCFGLMDRLFTATVLFIISPLVIGFSPIKDSTAVWRSAFIAKIMSAYGVIIGINILIILIKIFVNLQVNIDPDLARKLIFSTSEITAFVQMFFVVACFSTLEKIIADIGGYLGGGSALTDGLPMYGEIKKGVKATMTVIKIAVDIAITVASIALAVGSYGAATPAAGAAVANTAKGVATAGKGVATVAKGVADAGKAARVAKQAADATKKGADAVKKGKEIYNKGKEVYKKVKKVTDNVSKIKDKADEIKGLFVGDKSGGEDIDESDEIAEYDEAFDQIDDKDKYNKYKSDRNGFLARRNQSQDKINRFDSIINDNKNYTVSEIEAAKQKRSEEMEKQEKEAEEFANKYSDEDIDKYERGIAAEENLDAMRSAKSDAQNRDEEKKKLRRDKLMTTYNSLREWGKSGIEDIIPAPLKEISKDWNSARETGNSYSDESRQALQNVKDNKTKRQAESFDNDFINSRLIAINKNYQTQKITNLMIEKVEFATTDLNKQMGKMVSSFNEIADKLNAEKLKDKKDQNATKIQDWEQTLDYYKEQMRGLNSKVVIDGTIVSNYEIKLDIGDFKNTIQEAIKKNANAEEINSIISEQLKKWGQEGNVELIKELRKVLNDAKADLGKK